MFFVKSMETFESNPRQALAYLLHQRLASPDWQALMRNQRFEPQCVETTIQT
ncbi:MAG: hypothetical protein KA004_06480 [Verrucomicrobiales bacterium]|nr:hypothetical protein [Verrucomicrobiales bacterium]